MSVDLHVHSIYSTGAREFPDAIFRCAREKGVRVVALSEHDTIDSLPEALEAAARHGLETFPGVEFFADARVVGGKSIHLLAYLFDPAVRAFRDLMARVTAAGRARQDAVLKRLEGRGVPVGQEALLDVQRKSYPEAVGRTVTGTHHMGLVGAAVRAALKKAGWLEPEIRAETHALLPNYPIEDIFPAVRAAGGLTMWAHPLFTEGAPAAPGAAPAPVRYGLDHFPDSARRASLGEIMADFKATARRLFDLGLDGFEAYSYKHDPAMVAALLDFAKEDGRPYSGGGDVHNLKQLDRMQVPDEVVGIMRRYRERMSG